MDTLIINVYDSGYGFSVIELNHGNGVHDIPSLEDLGGMSMCDRLHFKYRKLSYEAFKKYVLSCYSEDYRRIIIIDNCEVDIIKGAKLI